LKEEIREEYNMLTKLKNTKIV